MKVVIYAQPENWNNIIEIIAASTNDIQVMGLSYHDLSQFEKNDVILSLEEVQQLKKYFSHLHYFYLQGGELLLNPDLPDYSCLDKEKKLFFCSLIILRQSFWMEREVF